MLRSSDKRLVAVVVGIVDRGLLLDHGVVPAIVYAECYESYGRPFQLSCCNCCVLLRQVVCKFFLVSVLLIYCSSLLSGSWLERLTWSIMAPITLSKDAKVAVLVLWKLGIESLQQRPDVRC